MKTKREPRKILNQEEFIRRCKEVHGYFYDYSKTVFTDTLKKVIVTCPNHGDFEQVANSHMIGSRCPECRKEEPKRINLNKFTTKFLARCIEVHGDIYDYSLVDYKRQRDNVKIICAIHGIFEQRPDSHLRGAGCQKCGHHRIKEANQTLYSRDDFIKMAKEANGYEYDYTLLTNEFYRKDKEKIEIICQKHGVFKQSAIIHLAGGSCKKCRNFDLKIVKKKSDFIRLAVKIHGGKYDYSKVKKPSSDLLVLIICPKHGDFWQNYKYHIRGSGCPTCGKKVAGQYRVLTTEEVIESFKKVHGDTYDYSKVNHVPGNKNRKVEIICRKHGSFFQASYSHLDGKGCRACSQAGFSKVAVRWMVQAATKMGINPDEIQHGLNGGEYRLPGTRIRVDGYHSKTNTVFEFHGDRWHGNPTLYHPDEICHPFTGKTAGTLYKETLKREQTIRRLGFNLITVWEHDYKKDLKENQYDV